MFNVLRDRFLLSRTACSPLFWIRAEVLPTLPGMFCGCWKEQNRDGMLIKTQELECSPKAGFLSLGTADILNWKIICCGCPGLLGLP